MYQGILGNIFLRLDWPTDWHFRTSLCLRGSVSENVKDQLKCRKRIIRNSGALAGCPSWSLCVLCCGYPPAWMHFCLLQNWFARVGLLGAWARGAANCQHVSHHISQDFSGSRMKSAELATMHLFFNLDFQEFTMLLRLPGNWNKNMNVTFKSK